MAVFQFIEELTFFNWFNIKLLNRRKRNDHHFVDKTGLNLFSRAYDLRLRATFLFFFFENDHFSPNIENLIKSFI